MAILGTKRHTKAHISARPLPAPAAEMPTGTFELWTAAERECDRLRKAVKDAHLVLTKSSLTADERVFDATAILSKALKNIDG